MDETITGEKTNEWNGFKLATFIVSVLSVLIIGAQAVYNNYYIQGWKEVEYLTGELERKRQEFNRQQALPKLQLIVNTLEQAGLLIEMFKSLTAIPSTIEIQHVSGGTAKGLLIEVIASEPILQFHKWQSIEDFTVKKLGGQNKSLRLEAPQLRKGATIGLTLLTRGIPKIETKTVIDTGEDVESQEKDSPSLDPDILRLGPKVISGLPDEFIKYLTRRPLPLESEIVVLEREIKALRSKTLLSWVTDYFKDPIFMLIVVLLIPVAVLVVMAVKARKSDQRRQLAKNKVIEEIKSRRFRPTTLPDALRYLGPPDALNVGDQADGVEVVLAYFSRYELGSDTKGIRFRFRDQELMGIFDEQGRQLL